MKKLLAISLIAAMTSVGAHADLTKRGPQISDVVRMMEENPEMVTVASDAIIIARATKAGAQFNTKAIASRPDLSKQLPTLKKTKKELKIVQIKPNTSSAKPQGHYNENGNYIPDTLADVELAIKAGSGTLCNVDTVNAIGDVMDAHGLNQTQQQKYIDQINAALNAGGCWFDLDYAE